MAMGDRIRNPVEWGWGLLHDVETAIARTAHAVRPGAAGRDIAAPEIRKITIADVRDALRRGVDDFGTFRTDVFFVCLIYPLVGLVLTWVAFGHYMVPLVFPLASGFALIGPVAAVGLYEMSRRREQGEEATWWDAVGVLRSPAFGAILVLGLILLALFFLWMAAATLIHAMTLGPESPESIGAFVSDVLTTSAGWAMIVIGIGVGFLFALLVLMISVVSFPLLLDRDVGLVTAVMTSVRAVLVNPREMAAWGLIVAGGLVLGTVPLFLGLIFVMPVLGHATWHLYRKVVVR
jgi:uncharacterized membrane protein